MGSKLFFTNDNEYSTSLLILVALDSTYSVLLSVVIKV